MRNLLKRLRRRKVAFVAADPAPCGCAVLIFFRAEGDHLVIDREEHVTCNAHQEERDARH